MMPIQTFLVLLAVLAALMTSCSQKLPPHPGDDLLKQQNTASNNLNQPNSNPGSAVKPGQNNPGTPGTNDPTMNALVMDRLTKPSEWSLRLLGPAAGKIFKLLVVAAAPAESGGGKVKQGRHFACYERDPAGYECVFNVAMPAGEVKEIVPVSSLKLAASEMAQAAESDGYLTIDPPGKTHIRLQVLFAYAKDLYEAMNPTSPGRVLVFKADASKGWGAGGRKAGEHLNCLQTSVASKPDEFTYKCYLHIDFSTGSLDSISVKDTLD